MAPYGAIRPQWFNDEAHYILLNVFIPNLTTINGLIIHLLMMAEKY